jgi:anti-anti-sigma factor
MPLDREPAPGASHRLVLEGRVDINRARALHQEVRALHDLAHDVCLDWGGVEALDAAGLQILLAFCVAMRASGLVLETGAPSPAVAQTLALAGLTTFFSGETAAP